MQHEARNARISKGEEKTALIEERKRPGNAGGYFTSRE